MHVTEVERESGGTERSVPDGQAGSGAATVPVQGGLEKEAKRRLVRRFVVSGAVPQESWADLLRCFVGPAARIT